MLRRSIQTGKKFSVTVPRVAAAAPAVPEKVKKGTTLGNYFISSVSFNYLSLVSEYSFSVLCLINLFWFARLCILFENFRLKIQNI